MPPSSPPSPKQPSLGRWIAHGALILIVLLVVGTIFGSIVRSMKRRSDEMPTTQSMGYAVGRAEMADMATAPSIAPMPPMAFDGYAMNNKAALRENAGGSGLNVAVEQPRVIKTADISLRVEDVPSSISHVRMIVAAKNGFVESSSVSDAGQGPRSAWVTIRIPETAFESTLEELRKHASVVLHESMHGQDVTMEFVDLEADLRNARAEEASYLEILKRSGEIEDVLAVTERLADVRGRIERIEGRKRYLENRTDLATISVSLTEETRVEVPGRTWKPAEIWRQAISDLIVALQNLVNFLIRAAVSIVGLLLPIVLLTLIVVWIGWKIFGAVRRRVK